VPLDANGYAVDIICAEFFESELYERINGISAYWISLRREKYEAGRYRYGFFLCLAAVKLFFLHPGD
jgi:hypothetical protein